MNIINVIIHTLIPFCFNKAIHALSTASHTNTLVISTGILFCLIKLNWICSKVIELIIFKHELCTTANVIRCCFGCWRNSTNWAFFGQFVNCRGGLVIVYSVNCYSVCVYENVALKQQKTMIKQSHNYKLAPNHCWTHELQLKPIMYI